MPKDFQLNRNYRFCQCEPSGRFLCFCGPAVVTVPSARVKMSASKEQSEGVTCVALRMERVCIRACVPMDGRGLTVQEAGGGGGFVAEAVGAEIGLSAVFTK